MKSRLSDETKKREGKLVAFRRPGGKGSRDATGLPQAHGKVTPPRHIGIDLPFDYDEVVRVTGPEYVENLLHEGVAFVPYARLRENPPVPEIRREECIWMKARIINFRLCDNKGDCDHCEFDLNMRRAMRDEVRLTGKPAGSEWEERVNRHFEAARKPCIYALLGKAGAPAECREDYECFQCAVHETQAISAEKEAGFEPRFRTVSGFRLAEDYFYHFGHLWAHMEKDGYVRVGIDDFAARLTGRASNVQLPAAGASVHQGEAGVVLHRNGNQAAMLAPLSGKVVAVNQRVLEDPSLCHRDPYGAGWLFLVEPYYLRNELKALYYGRESADWVEKENRLLLQSMGPEYERLAATGGEPVDDIFGGHPEVGWDSLASTFFRTRVRGDAE